VPTDRVLDIGSGNGQTTRDAALLATAGSVLGVDLSSRMIEIARDSAFLQRGYFVLDIIDGPEQAARL
jgi:SAM-dependent methyltransferase